MAVAVSGGADSLYALLRLRESGRPLFALHGVFLKPGLWDESARREREREAGEGLEALSRACEGLGVPLHIVDLSDAFLDKVIRPFVQSYALGLTPNPCALCNARIKFGLLLDEARALGAERLATGHYVRLTRERDGPALWQGADALKDQSYFLALVGRDNLAAASFPLGETHKEAVLATLARRGITPPQPKESQETCFVPGDDYRAFLPRAAAALGLELSGPGAMQLADGRRLGTHKGLWQYTEGQRRGLGLGWKEPLYVIGKERKDNLLRLGPKEELRSSGCSCAEANILLPPEFWPDIVLVKTRYRERPKAARVLVDGLAAASLDIRFLEADAAIAQGQIAAVYIACKGQASPLRLVAGGVITGTC